MALVDFIVQWKEMDTEKKTTLIGGVSKFHNGKGREGFPIARGPKNTEGDPETQQSCDQDTMTSDQWQ
jgi:hypothetical protein